MFRRSNKNQPEFPKPPTKNEILDDLKTFHVVQPIPEKIRESAENRAGKSPSSPTTSSEESVGDWWLKFETFLSDIDELKNYQQHLEFKKNDLKDLNHFVSKEARDIQDNLNENIVSVKRLLEEESD